MAACICWGIYKLYKWIKDKIEDKIIDINRRKAKKKETEKERLSQMTDEQIKEEKQINWEMKFVILVIWVVVILGGIIFVIKNYW